MKLIDLRTLENAPMAYFLSRMEFKEIYPHRLNSKIDYIFKHKVPLDVPNVEGELLLKKYHHIIRFGDEGKKKTEPPKSNRHQELSRKKYKTLRRLARELGIPGKEAVIKREILTEMIIEKEIKKAEQKAKAKALREETK